jgi:hypothetical protein
MPDGANLRETALDRDMLVMTIKCGRPGRDMPAYDRSRTAMDVVTE